VYRLGLHVDPGPLLGLACGLYVKQLVRADLFSFFSFHAGDKSHGLFSVLNRHHDLQFLSACTSGKRGFYPPPLVPKLFRPGLKGALVSVRSTGAWPAPSPGL
jgi:hypothetical protein